MFNRTHSFSRRHVLLSSCVLIVLSATVFSVACNHGTSQPGTANSQSSTKRYTFKGKVISVDKNAGTANIDNEPIAGFMDPMIMPYSMKPASMLDQVQPGDSITAEVVVEPEKYWLENVKVTGHSQPSAKPAASMHIPSPGDEVPDFKLVNQSGKNISLHQYRGQTLLLTLIYTRCPFPDFCPRMSANFAEAYKQLTANPAIHLLSISFDPEHDTPKVLRDHGFSVAHSHDPALFTRWEFAVPTAADLPKIADFFALTVKPEGGLITHTLSTAVIGPDGKIAKWYHGGDWQASDLIKDASMAAMKN